MNFSRPSLPAPIYTRHGSALAATMMVVLALMTFLSIAGLITSQFSRFAARQEGDNELVAAADAGLEYIYAQFQASTRSLFIAGTNHPVSSDFDGVNGKMKDNLNSASRPFAEQGIQFNTATIKLAKADGSEDGSTTAIGTLTSNVPGYPGWSGTTFTYVAKVQVTTTSTGYHLGFLSDSRPTVTLTRVFQVTQVPLFQAAIFYENKLEIHPGATMKVTGLVHTNGDLWARGFEDLTFLSDVSYVGSYTPSADPSLTQGWDGFGKGIKPGVYPYQGSPQPTYGTGADLTKVSTIDPFGGANQADNALHTIVDLDKTFANGSLSAYDQASLIIAVNSASATNPTLTITVKDGDNSRTVLSPNDPDYIAVAAAVKIGSGNTFFDHREGSYVTATTLDMSKLALATTLPAGKSSGTALQNSFKASNQADPNNSAKSLAQGTVYIYDANPTTSTMPSIRLVNGSVLGQNVTVASANPVYIQGDYNTGGTGTAVVSNQNNSDGKIPTTGTATTSTYNRYSSAVMADAVTILSSAWQDGYSHEDLYTNFNYNTLQGTPNSHRVAKPTTVNTAILSGDLPSNYKDNGLASGGAHNFPRFLECWNNVNFTYYGSLVEAFRSTTADSVWQTGQVYYWPNRRWNFDTNFQTSQPPGVPNGISYSRGRWTRTNG